MVEPIWYEQTYVRTSETDFRSQWKVSSFFSAMVEAAAHHADHLGFGYHSMMASDKIWILSRLKIRFFRFPKIEEKITIQTWPRGIGQKVFFIRDYHILSETRERLASATSAYLLVSPSARRMLPPQALQGSLPPNDGLAALDEPLEKIPPAEPLSVCFHTTAGYSAVDLMGHVNNTHYIDWVTDCFSFDDYEGKNIRWLQINYVNEVKPGENVAVSRAAYADNPGAWYITGSNETTGMKAFEAALDWE